VANLGRGEFRVVILVVQLAIEPQGRETVGLTPGGHPEDVGLVVAGLESDAGWAPEPHLIH
jgi:hypothetical protein